MLLECSISLDAWAAETADRALVVDSRAASVEFVKFNKIKLTIFFGSNVSASLALIGHSDGIDLTFFVAPWLIGHSLGGAPPAAGDDCGFEEPPNTERSVGVDD